MKVIQAHEDHEGMVTALVEFPDGNVQNVILPKWADKKNFIDEAKRLRSLTEDKEARKVRRQDLEDGNV